MMKTVADLANEFIALFGNRLEMNTNLELKILNWFEGTTIWKRDKEIIKLIDEMMPIVSKEDEEENYTHLHIAHKLAVKSALTELKGKIKVG